MSNSKIIYYKDELNDDFARNNIKTQQIPSNYRYINTNIFYRFGAFFLYYLIAKPVIWTIMKVQFCTKLKNRKVLKSVRGKGHFIYANHTSDTLDAFRPNTLRLFRKNYILANPDAFSIRGLKTIVTMLGAIPTVEQDLRQQVNVLSTVEHRINQKASVTIYPEKHIWPYYTKIRPFLSAAFHYPVKLSKPIIVLTTTYHSHKGLLKWIKRPRVIHYLDGPFYPDQNLCSSEAKQKLRDEVYEAMLKRSNENEQYEYVKYIKKD